MHYKVEVDFGEEILTGDLFTPKQRAKFGIVLVHGWNSSNKKYQVLAAELAKKKLLALAINLRGHGDSPYPLAKFSRKDHLTDIVTAIDYLKTKYKIKEVIVLGKSYGGYLAALASSLRKISYLILSQPALYPDRDFETPVRELLTKEPEIYRTSGESVTSNRALKAVSEYPRPLLLIESEKDQEVPAVVTEQYRLIVNEKKENLSYTLVKADHSLSRPEYLNDFYGRVSRWLRKFGLFN